MKKELNAVLPALLAALLIAFPGCTKEPAGEPAETEEPFLQGITLDGILPSDEQSEDAAPIDFSALTEDTLNAWAESAPMDFASADRSS